MTNNKTISDACKAWIKRCERDELERATLRSYRNHVDHHIEPAIGDRELSALTRSHVRDFMDDMLDKNSRAMTDKVLRSLRSALNEALDREWIDNNVALSVKLRRASRNAPDRIIPTKVEIKAMLEIVPDKQRPLITTAIYTGMRMSELRGLRWEDVDFQKSIIRVRQRADRFNQIGKPKSKSGRRDIPMAPSVKKVLMAWKADCPTGDLDLVFPNGVGNVESPSNISNRVLYPLLKDAGIVTAEGKPKFSFHALRHAAASLYIEQGWPAKKIQTLLGHASITMTFDVYGHLFDNAEDDVELFAKLEADLEAA
ncbi:site-specific integrase [Labrenzia sp. R4_2]|uniref:tyrosine-type recombinase/integrase n=1 Tax=Labrenzia sp. R4_2 TaxID=2821107 RepID=UPI001ADBB22C|nr:site-specific integrase [Labrenzia sp. R4_2]MBO9422357.1 site-specific integrase [Labrenzia sp. R4_2]